MRTTEARIDKAIFPEPHSLSGVLVCDSRGRVLLCNDVVEQMIGSRAADLEGQPVAVLIPDIAAGDAPLGKDSRYPANPDVWRRLRAVGAAGEKQFDICLSKFEVDGAPLFLLRLRHPGGAGSHRSRLSPV